MRPATRTDIAFVHVKARGLPSLQLDAHTRIEEGMNICTAGFPMGTYAFIVPWMYQSVKSTVAWAQTAVRDASAPWPAAIRHRTVMMRALRREGLEL